VDLAIVSEKKRRTMVGRTQKEKNIENDICFDCKIQIKIGDTSIDYSEKRMLIFQTDR
jgi:hypothetical protein